MQPRLLPLTAAALFCTALCPSATAQGMLISIDYHGPTIGTPDSIYGWPITEADLLGTTPSPAPVGTPGIVYGGGPSPTFHDLGLTWYPPAVGHPPGVMGFVEVDALSLGRDPLVSADMIFQPGSIAFSVDEYAAGVPANPLVPEIASESMVGDASADVFTNVSRIPIPNPPAPLFQGRHIGHYDGDGMASGSGFSYPGLGLIEPSFPQGPPPDTGDNLDALELVHEDWSAIFFSLDSLYTDPHPLMGGLINSGSAFAQGFVGSDILMKMPGVAGPMLYAPSAALGLGMTTTDPDHDDVDALILWDNGNLTFEAPQRPDDWIFGGTDMIFFSVRRGSAIIGAIDSLRGMPIEEGDILMPPISPAFGGLSPNPGIYVPAEMLGLATVRAGTASLGFPAFGFADDLNALDLFPLVAPGPALLAAEFCHCAGAIAPCGNADPLAGCANSTGVGAHMTASGSSSVGADNLVLTTDNQPAATFGLPFMGTAIVPPVLLGDGIRCVGGGLFRHPVQLSDAAGTTVTGPGIVGWTVANLPLPGQITVGSTWVFQYWYRDTFGPCGTGSNLSNAVTVTFTL